MKPTLAYPFALATSAWPGIRDAGNPPPCQTRILWSNDMTGGGVWRVPAGHLLYGNQLRSTLPRARCKPIAAIICVDGSLP